MTIDVRGVPALTWTHGDGRAHEENGVLVLTSDAEVDWTNDATGTDAFQTSTSLSFDLEGPFQLSARVSVDSPRTTFDAGALTLWVDGDHWAKLCFECSPQGEEMVVSVVTDRYSDDANGPVVLDGAVWLRISSLAEGAFAFHYSRDGVTWHFVRQFRMPGPHRPRIGFMSQAPMGPSAVSRFSEITLVRDQLADVRDGS